ncbi:hypothetical protein GGX14DRAFT_392328 [Mycena pura]|uniref:Uncharacterized protein n=1 Tax=Mycena pura TaxID=153505 RepID=A0AAD6VKW4_9AGAR|nr:hypothetical protein GGX14DRAFT_392328 [Mycena pura]
MAEITIGSPRNFAKQEQKKEVENGAKMGTLSTYPGPKHKKEAKVFAAPAAHANAYTIRSNTSPRHQRRLASASRPSSSPTRTLILAFTAGPRRAHGKSCVGAGQQSCVDEQSTAGPRRAHAKSYVGAGRQSARRRCARAGSAPADALESPLDWYSSFSGPGGGCPSGSSAQEPHWAAGGRLCVCVGQAAGRRRASGCACASGRRRRMCAGQAARRVFIGQRQRGHCVGRPAAAHAQDQSTSRPVLVAHAPSPASGRDSNRRATATHAQGRRQRTRSMRPPRTGACRDADVGTRAARRGRRRRAEGAEGVQTAQGARGACRRREGRADDETHRSCGRVVDVQQQHARGGGRAAVRVHKAGDGVAIESGGGSHMRAKAWSRGAGGRKQISTWKWMRKSDTPCHPLFRACQEAKKGGDVDVMAGVRDHLTHSKSDAELETMAESRNIEKEAKKEILRSRTCCSSYCIKNLIFGFLLDLLL